MAMAGGCHVGSVGKDYLSGANTNVNPASSPATDHCKSAGNLKLSFLFVFYTGLAVPCKRQSVFVPR